VFFKVIGAVLMVFAAGLLADAVQNMQELGWLPVLTHQLWHTGSLLSEDSALGDIFHAFFGYADSPTVGQLVVYVGYLSVVISAFLWWHPRKKSVAPSSQSAAVEASGGSAVSAGEVGSAGDVAAVRDGEGAARMMTPRAGSPQPS
jgi:high-affinity iron transporter